jgi:hypothetical protein
MTKRQAVNMLKEIKKVALEASLTGALSSGSSIFVNTYNSIRQKAIGEKWLDDDGLIPALDINGNTSMDSVGCASALLMGLLLED